MSFVIARLQLLIVIARTDILLFPFFVAVPLFDSHPATYICCKMICALAIDAQRDWTKRASQVCRRAPEVDSALLGRTRAHKFIHFVKIFVWHRLTHRVQLEYATL